MGYDNSIGYLQGGFEAWQTAGKEVDTLETLDLQTFAQRYQSEPRTVLDVRKPGEYASIHLQDSQNFPLDFINQHLSEINREQPYYLHCRSGYRSTVAASILKARGYDQLVNIHGKVDDMAAAGLDMMTTTCSTQR